jgi:hypothetical protein
MPATYMTIELSNNSKSIYVKTNDLPSLSPAFDWAEGYYRIEDVESVKLGTNNQGVDVLMKSGEEFSFTIEYVTSVGAMLVGTDITTNQELFEAIAKIIGLKS